LALQQWRKHQHRPTGSTVVGAARLCSAVVLGRYDDLQLAARAAAATAGCSLVIQDIVTGPRPAKHVGIYELRQQPEMQTTNRKSGLAEACTRTRGERCGGERAHLSPSQTELHQRTHGAPPALYRVRPWLQTNAVCRTPGKGGPSILFPGLAPLAAKVFPVADANFFLPPLGFVICPTHAGGVGVPASWNAAMVCRYAPGGGRKLFRAHVNVSFLRRESYPSSSSPIYYLLILC